jgi:hypothetical protein
MALSFLDKIFALFTGAGDPAVGKKRLLKQVSKNLNANKYGKFYKVKTGQAEPALAKFFFDMYRIIASAQVFMQNAGKSGQLKQVVIETFLDEGLLEKERQLSEESIAERARKTPPKELSRQLRDELAAFSNAFDSTLIGAVDGCYNLILAFTQFVSFDYFFLLKKFDPSLKERSFNRTPKFGSIRGDQVTDLLKDFLEIAAAVDPDQDWRSALKALKTYKGDMDVVVFDQWSRLLIQLRDIKRSQILELMIRHIDNDPVWQIKPKIPGEHIVDSYLEALRTGIEGTIDRIVNAKRNAQINELVKNVFAGVSTNRLKHYNENNSNLYTKKNFAGFIHLIALNYLKAFLLDYFKKDIRELCDLFLIRGQWSSNVLSQQLSDGFHEIIAVSEQLTTFDEALADNGSNGSRLKAAIVKVDRDRGQAKYIRLILTTVNEEAEAMIKKAAQALISVGRNFKGLLDDYHKMPHELIVNWKELELSSEIPLTQRITASYKKIYYFVQILQLLTLAQSESGE